jgi:2-dehydro-3-deoxygluconokinase
MVELTRGSNGAWNVGYAGDTYNTAVYLARLGCKTSYLTAVGEDPFSAEMRAAWCAEGIDASLALVDPDHLAGIYAVQTDSVGEREFYYWREHSAARYFFRLPGAADALDNAANAGLLYLSGITLSLFNEAERAKIVSLCREVRARGGRVAFDPNYRPRGWPNPSDAKAAISSIAPYVTTALPTFEDEATLFGDGTPERTAQRWRSLGVEEVVIKLGASGCTVVGSQGAYDVPARKVAAKDTTGAGDSFNAAYLAARAGGASLLEAAQEGHRLASKVVLHAGAIIPKSVSI